MRRFSYALLLCLFFALSGAHAAAVSPTARAKAEAAYAAGAKSFQNKKFEVALKYFEDAYLLDPVPILLYNIARAHEELKHYDHASRYLSRYLDRAPPDAPDRTQVEQRLSLLRAAAQASKDAESAREDAKRARAEADAAREGKPFIPTVEKGPPEQSNWVAWTLMGTGGLSLLLGLGSWAEAVDATNEANALADQIKNMEFADASEEELRQARDAAIERADNRVKGAWVLGTVGVAAGLLGWYLYEGGAEPVGIAPTPNGLGIYGRF